MDKREVTKGLSKARKHYKKYERIRINRTVRRKEKVSPCSSTERAAGYEPV